MPLTAAATVRVRGRDVSAADVQRAMNECDSMGIDAFLTHYGFRRSTRYWLRGPKNHRRYPSKAVLCVAAGLKASDYFGGAAHTVSVLQRLGFDVREGDEPLSSVGINALREACVDAGFDDPAPDWDKVRVTPAAVFASGSNRAGEIRGMARVGMDVGVAAPHVTPTSEAELLRLAGTDVQVFVDSGAFSEVKFNTSRGAFDVVKPIDHDAWLQRLALYRRLGAALREQAWLVAPDQVGSQEVTLQRLRRYRAELAEIAATGARILVVAQKGAMSQAEFYRAAVEAAGLTGLPNVVAALPCKKAATTADEVAAFVADAGAPHVHLLGKGPSARDVQRYLAPFESGEVSVSLDACWITANVGKTNGKGGGERRYTKAQRIAARVLHAAGRITSVACKRAKDYLLKLELALALCLGAPLPAASTVVCQLSLFAS